MDRLHYLPGLVLVTDAHGSILDINAELLDLVGRDKPQWLAQQMDQLLTLPSTIFLQTHILPTLLRNGSARELRVQLKSGSGRSIPVLANVKLGLHEDHTCYYWLFFVAQDRSRFEAEVLEARARAGRGAQIGIE